jgi:hypothetical protein
VPDLAPDAVTVQLGVIVVPLAGNLRGVRQAGNLFAARTYAFVVVIFLVIAVGLTHAAETGFRSHPASPLPATEAVTLFLVLRAFSSGATSMIGVEAGLQRRASVPPDGVAQRDHHPDLDGGADGGNLLRPGSAGSLRRRRARAGRDGAIATIGVQHIERDLLPVQIQPT